MRASSLFLLSLFIQGAMALELKVKKQTPTQSTGESKPVFYIVVMGKLAYRHQVSMWLSSVRLIGGYKGEVVIVTDKPVCLAKTLAEAKLLGEQLSTNGNVNVYGPAEGYEGNIHMIKRPSTGDINKMKLEKARGWLNIKVSGIPHPVSSIVYTDEDVICAKNLDTFMGLVKELEQKKHTLALFRDTGASAGELHTGLVIMFPGQDTDTCLQSWAKHLTGIKIGSSTDMSRRKPIAKLNAEDAIEQEEEVGEIKEEQLLAEEMLAMGPDQQALAATKACKKSPGHDGIKILPKEFFWLPTPGGLKQGKTVEFVHFTNTGRWVRISHTLIKSYLVKIGIPAHIDPMGHVADKTCADDK